jgi:PhnB protein
MAILTPYLVFSGNCKEAMQFYARILNGNITSLTTFGESPIEVPVEFENRIFNLELKAGSIHLKASDDLPNHQVKGGNNISLFVSFSDQKEKENVFAELAHEGKVLFPLDDNFGMLKDKFGIQWMMANE